MARSIAIFSIVHLALLGLFSTGFAGDATPRRERQEFHQSANYPYIFEPVNYLLAQGPAPMRYGPPASEPALRSAPVLPKIEPPKIAKSVPSDNAATDKTTEAETTITAASAPDATEPSSKVNVPPPAYPVPQNAPASAAPNEADFGKTPDEVVGYFRNPYNFVPDSHRFFDPIFEPAQMQKGPPSKAVYKITK